MLCQSEGVDDGANKNQLCQLKEENIHGFEFHLFHFSTGLALLTTTPNALRGEWIVSVLVETKETRGTNQVPYRTVDRFSVMNHKIFQCQYVALVENG